MNISACDAHCHADILMAQDAEFETVYRKLELGGISWSYAQDISSWQDYPAYWRHLGQICREFNARGLPFYYLVGIHPRCIPQDLDREDHLPLQLEKDLQWHLDQPLCRGLGELGLETGDEREKKVLFWQLNLAEDHLPGDKKIGVHTPRKNKNAMTWMILDLVREYPGLQRSILIDHVTLQTWSWVWEEGYMLGMTLQPGKCDHQELYTVLNQDPRLPEKLIVNSDGAKEMSRPFLQAIQYGLHLDRDTRQKILLENAREFWGLE